MGRQVNFYLHPKDYQEIEDLLKKSGDVVFLPYYHYDNKVSITDTTIPVDIKKEGQRIYVLRRSDLDQITLWHIEKFKYWLIEDSFAPVLHYDRCQFTGENIVRGRFYFQPQFVRDMQWVKKSDEFVDWADKILKATRRKLKKYHFDKGNYQFSEYVGQNTREWLDKTKKEKGINDATLVSV